jgi:PAS domain S-box-containing protein
MDVTIILGVSLLIQLIAVGFSLSLAKTTGNRRAWLAIAAAVLLMAIPRSITFIRLVRGDIHRPPNLESELVALDVSFLMGVGLAWVGQLFRSVQRSRDELLRSKRELIEHKSRCEILFQYVPDGIFITDLEGRFVDMNAAGESVIGYSRGQTLGKTFEEISLFHSSDIPRMRDAMVRVRRGEAVLPRLFDVRRQDGKKVVVEARFFPIHLDNEQLMLGIVQDVTEHLRFAEEKDMLEAQLRRSQKLETIGTLAGGIAHDFNNILTPILGYAEIAAMDAPPEAPTRATIEHVVRAAMRAKDLVRQILLFSRQAEQERKPLRLQMIVKEVLKLLRASLPATIEIRLQINELCGPVIADASQMHQVIMNLCTNSFHAMRDQVGILSVALDEVNVEETLVRRHPGLKVGTYVRLSVADTGHGIDPTVIERIFEPFFTTKAAGEGTGLGLSVVHGIVTQHGGVITVESQPGQGTTFVIYLPLAQAEEGLEITVAAPMPTGRERILLVDDEEEVTAVGRDLLERLGYTVTVRTSSVEALQAYQALADRIDLVITDHTMPQLTGLQLAGRIRGVRPDIPIVLITGFGEIITPEICAKHGIQELVLKPIVPSELAQSVRRALDGKGAATPKT